MRFSSGRGSTFSSHMMRSVLALALLMPLAACDTISDMNPFGSDDKYKPEIKPTVPAEVLYNQGLAYAQKSSWDDAAKKFAEVDKQYPFSNWSKKALILQTSAHYNAKNYDEAIATGRRYLGLYPAADDASYAAYMVAASYYNQIPDVTRDQERAEKALLALQEVVQRWP
jgi:outer membrane protein assembly factor BamD